MAIKLIETGEVLYEGAVIRVINGASFQVMSDIWGSCTDVEVFDVAENRPKKLSFNFSDNGHVWSKADCNVDVTDEVWEKYRAYQLQKQIENDINNYKIRDKVVKQGDIVRVVKGKTAKGVEGKVVFIKAGGMARYGYRMVDTNSYCVALSDLTVKVTSPAGREYDRHVDTVWVYARNCEKVNLTEPNIEEITQNATKHVDYLFANKKKVFQAA
jgi:hypothetical protein